MSERINANGRQVCYFGMDNLDMLHNNPENTTYVIPLTSTKHEHFTDILDSNKHVQSTKHSF